MTQDALPPNDQPLSHMPRIYLAYHKESPLISGRNLVPIQVGRALAEQPLHQMMGDDTGAHISALNPVYCELTAHYWAWKNDADATHLGLMHYRRLLDLGQSAADWRAPERFCLSFDPKTYIAQAEAALSAQSIDVVTPRPLRLLRSVEAQYARCHDPQDLAVLREKIALLRPDFYNDFEQSLSGNRLIIGNIFIMRRPIFDHYSTLLFALLDAVYQARPPQDRDSYQRRYIGFLAERILSAYIQGDLLRKTFDQPQILSRTVLNIGQTEIASAPALGLARHAARGQISWGEMVRLVIKRRSRRTATSL